MSASLARQHFFKPLLPGFEDEFIIPAPFFKHFNGGKYDKAMLGSRKKGKLWPVDINGRQFGDGWRQFVQDHDLKMGDFLVFRHEGNLVFHVLVFDPTACERQYPPFAAAMEEDPVEIQERNPPNNFISDHPPFTAMEEEPIEIQERNSLKDSSSDHPPPTAMEEEPVEIEEQNLPNDSSGDHPPSTALEEEPVEIEEQNLSKDSTSALHFPHIVNWFHSSHADHSPFTSMEEEPIDIEEQYTPKDSSSGKKFQLKKKVETEIDAEAEAKARSSKTEFPSFIARITKGTLQNGRLYISRNFARENDLYGRSSMLILKDEEGNCWPAKLDCKHSAGQNFVTGGWKDFQIAHNFKKGDLIIVELARNGKIPVLKLRKHQNIKQENSNQNDEEAGSSSPRQNEYHSWKSRKCFFVAEVTSQSKLYIPTKIVKLNFHNTNYREAIFIDRKGKIFPAILRRKSPDEVYVAYGWNKFRVANNLKPGDSFVFEFIEKVEKPEFRMYDFKANHKAGNNLEAASSSIEKPCFYVTVESSNVRDGQIRIPTDFAVMNGIFYSYRRCSEMTIRNETGNSWPVRLKDGENGEVFVKYGWSEFAEANDIKEGDVFMLELIKRGPTLMMNYYAAKQSTERSRRGMWEDLEDVNPVI